MIVAAVMMAMSFVRTVLIMVPLEIMVIMKQINVMMVEMRIMKVI